MELETLMEKIQLPEEGRNCAGSFPMTETVYQKWKNLFYEDTKTFFEEADKRTDKEQFYLCLYLRLACDLYPAFMEKGISVPRLF